MSLNINPQKKLVNQAKILSAITDLLKHEKYVQRKILDQTASRGGTVLFMDYTFAFFSCERVTEIST